MLTNIKKSAGLLHQDLLKSSLILFFAHGKPWSLKFSFQDLDSNTLTLWEVPTLNLKLKKEHQASTRVSSLSGLVKSHTLLSSSSLSNGLSNSSMTTSSPLARRTTLSPPNWELHSLPAIWLVSSALSSRTPLIPWWANFTVKEKVKDQLDLRLLPFTNKSASRDCGLVWLQELSWLVPLLVSNGGFMIHSKLPWD